MNLTQLKAFHFVAREGSFTRAAERLCVTQPAVTASIAALEERHGVPLFHRQGRKISLTHAGENLASIATQLFALEEEATDYLNSAQVLKSGRLRIAIGSPYGIAPVLRQFRTAYPGIEVQLLPGNFKNVEEMLISEEADLAIQTEAAEMPGIIRKPFQDHQLIAFCHRDHPIANNLAPVNLRHLMETPLILRERDSITRQLFEDLCRNHDYSLNCVIEAGSREAVQEMVRERLGVGIVLSGEIRPDADVTALPIAEMTEPITDYLLYLERRQNLRILNSFLALLP